MKFAINIAAVAVLLLASAPAFAHGGGMGHMGGGMGHMGGNMGANMSGNMGKTSQPPTVTTATQGMRQSEPACVALPSPSLAR